MIIEVQHETRFEYTQPIAEWLTEVRMQPLTDNQQSCHSFHVAVSHPSSVFSYLDGFGNCVHHFNVLSSCRQVNVLAASVVETWSAKGELLGSQSRFPLALDHAEPEVLDFLSYRGPIGESSLLSRTIEQLRPDGDETVGGWLGRVGTFIRDSFEYAKAVTDSASPVDVVLQKRKGVCQDFAHLMIAIARSQNVPSRYVSGYIHDVHEESQSHAWCEFWLPDQSWVGYDPTNACEIDERFVRVATGRDYSDVPPNKGTFRGKAGEQIGVRVATRELSRVPSLSWHEHLPPIKVPLTAVSRYAAVADIDEQGQQQQQHQQQQ